ncbi:hypothetical protein B0A49_11072 [Cryomyces minteri]|uniref:MARVEL domain-containing protein n=1 Tax=Cryomyces minteri TaxID=331657 RepID=A0A4U0VPY2_9PEZI|nr:hypothetical protein B0A49_11072 [Cryomyces minteri]
MFNSLGERSHSGGLPGLLLRLFLRFFQFVLALTVAGLYGVDLHRAHQVGVYYDGKWMFAEVMAGASAITCLVYFLPFIKSYWFFAWDLILFILWTALFGIFAKIYIPARAGSDAGIQRMKNAVWIDLANMLLWLVTAVYGAVIWKMNRGSGRTLHTGRAQV